MTVAIGGGTPTVVARSQASSESFNDVALDGTTVYWTDDAAQVSSIEKSGAPACDGGACLLASQGAISWALAVDSTTVYWTGAASAFRPSTSGTVMSVGLAGGAVSTLVPANPLGGAGDFMGIAVDSNYIYWTEGNGVVGGAVVRLPKLGGTPKTLAVSGRYYPVGIAVDDTNVYWADRNDGAIHSVPIGGGTVGTLASSDSPWSIAIDSTTAYWTNLNGGTVMSVPLTGGTPTVLASGQSAPRGIAVDATSVYWANNGGTVMKVTPK
jgi:sugar lactone lactonase YvrE